MNYKPPVLPEELSDLPDRVSKTFIGKTIFITGGSGFLGKVLIEKILRKCPEIERIYLLIRPKKGSSPKQRVETIFSSVVSFAVFIFFFLPIFLLKKIYTKSIMFWIDSKKRLIKLILKNVVTKTKSKRRIFREHQKYCYCYYYYFFNLT